MSEHIEIVHTTFLGCPVTIKMSLFDDSCARCGADILIPVLPDGIYFCEECAYQNLTDEGEPYDRTNRSEQ